MTSSRLTWMLVLAAALLALRWWTWPRMGAVEEHAVVPALPRASAARTDKTAPSPSNLAADTREPETAPLRDAFAVRQPPAPPAPPPVKVAVAPVPKPFVGPLEYVAPPPPPPPYQVIGSWRDDSGPSVFLVGPRGVVQARVGDTLPGDFRIAQITPQQVMLRHVPANRDASLPVPPASQAALTASK
jgi:hypothetical protein